MIQDQCICFFARVQRVLSKNHGGVPPRGLWDDLVELERDAKDYYYCDSYIENYIEKNSFNNLTI